MSLAGEHDINLGSPAVQDLLINHIPGAKIHEYEHRRYTNASHFIQEDVGEIMADYVADFILGTTSISTTTETRTEPPTMAPSGESRSTMVASTLWFWLLLSLVVVSRARLSNYWC